MDMMNMVSTSASGVDSLVGRKRKTQKSIYAMQFKAASHRLAASHDLFYMRHVGSHEVLADVLEDILAYFTRQGVTEWNDVRAVFRMKYNTGWTARDLAEHLHRQEMDMESIVHVILFEKNAIPKWNDLYQQDKIALHFRERMDGIFLIPQGHIDGTETAWIYWTSPHRVTYGLVRKDNPEAPTRYMLRSCPIHATTFFRLTIELSQSLDDIQNASNLMWIGVTTVNHLIDLKQWADPGMYRGATKPVIQILVQYDYQESTLTLRHSVLPHRQIVSCPRAPVRQLFLRMDYPVVAGDDHPRTSIELQEMTCPERNVFRHDLYAAQHNMSD